MVDVSACRQTNLSFKRPTTRNKQPVMGCLLCCLFPTHPLLTNPPAPMLSMQKSVSKGKNNKNISKCLDAFRCIDDGCEIFFLCAHPLSRWPFFFFRSMATLCFDQYCAPLHAKHAQCVQYFDECLLSLLGWCVDCIAFV